MNQLTLQLDLPLTPPRFDGPDINERDTIRLAGQMARVFELMSDGNWRTLSEILIHAGGSEAGCSARLRDLRKKRFGGYTVNRRRRYEGHFEYQLLI
jgi:hypothetical protein